MKSPSERFVILVLLLLEVIQLVQAAPPTFITPDPNGGTSPRSVDENAPKDQSILTVEGQDTDGDILSFSIVSQIPISPPFELNTTSGEFKTPAGLNYETHTSYTFRFGVSDGSPTVTSVDFIVNINDLNDEFPVFSPTSYTQNISLAWTVGTPVLTVSATDADISPAFNTITFSITGGDTNSLFVIGSSTGQINTTSNPLVVGAYALTIQASDTTNTATATATINVVDFCDRDPCQNGNCSNTISGYICTCESGYYGPNCTEVDFCYSNPCFGSSTCSLNSTYNYTCACAEGFIGRNCEEVDFCYLNPCFGDSTCSLNNTYNYTCACAEGFFGRHCDEVDFCYSNPCFGGSTCSLNSTYNYTCACAEGLLGRHCEEVDFCYSNPCLGGSTCTLNNTYNYTCTCAEGFFGRHCEQVDFCLANNCSEGSTCILNNDNYSCHCAKGYFGRYCKKVDYCASNPCQNSGTCENTPTGYTCNCTSNYTGTNCETLITTNGPTTTTTTTTTITSSSSSSVGASGTTVPVLVPEGQIPTTDDDGDEDLAWIAAVVIGLLLFALFIACLLRKLGCFTCHKVPFCGVPIEKWISRTSNRQGSDTSDEDAMKPMTETGTSPKVEKADPAKELESQPPNTDKEENRSDIAVNKSSEKYMVNTDEKPSLRVMSETNKTENGELKDTSNNAEAKSSDSHIDTKEDISSTSM